METQMYSIEGFVVKVGNLVRCKFQPMSSGYNTKTGCMKPMLYHIKEEVGLVIGERDELSVIVYFPKFAYEHTISRKSLELINGSR
tara:strand:+ start:577 stop:834 length:258 start_codon:yes stop_codon:yes gene_type:complete